ncbi:MAG: hypothetical protein KatS3mg125_1895 [Lysobacterales bacterium]|nr:MAG: hypothetical protein KatS3mg125_1895 [Xanthomonadales bacterium]
MKRFGRSSALVTIPLLLATHLALAESGLVGFEAATDARPPPPWRLASERRQRPPQFDVIEQEGRKVLMVYSASAEGRLEQPLGLAPSESLRLNWRWRVDEHAQAGDLADPAKDDHALRLCVRVVPDPERAGERTRRGLAALLGGSLRHTLCYLWDARYPSGHLAWSADESTRLIVLRGAETPTGRWQYETRDLIADYRQHFGAEAKSVELLWLSARSSGTGARTLAFFADPELLSEPTANQP